MSQLETAGRALYGEGWMSPLAEALSVNLRSVRRWAAGEAEIPPGVWDDLRGLLLEHGEECRAIARNLPA